MGRPHLPATAKINLIFTINFKIMSYTLHVAKVHRIEFGMNFFNHETGPVNMFLQEIFEETDTEYGFFYEGEEIRYSDHLEVWKETWQKMIEVVEQKPDGELLDNMKGHIYTKDQVLRFMRSVLNDSDPDNGTIHLYWF